MATPKKSPNTKQAQKKTKPNNSKTKVKQAEPKQADSRKTIGIVIALLAGLFVVGYFLFGANPFASEDSASTEQSKTQVAADGEETTEKTENKSDGTSEDKAEEGATQQTDNQSTQTVATESDKEYGYTAGTAESYTTLARRAVAQAGTGLTNAERVAAETKLTQDANADLLEVGQDVRMSKADVAAAVDWAKSLSDDAKAAWQPYADQVAW